MAKKTGSLHGESVSIDIVSVFHERPKRTQANEEQCNDGYNCGERQGFHYRKQ